MHEQILVTKNKPRIRCNDCRRLLIGDELTNCIPKCVAGWRRESFHALAENTFDEIVDSEVVEEVKEPVIV